MKTETIKDIITARWKFTANNAESIAKIARRMVETEMLDADALNQIDGYRQDMDVNLESITRILWALSDAAKEVTTLEGDKK